MLDGEFVRFYHVGEAATAIALPLYTQNAEARTLNDGEVFYLTDVYGREPAGVAVSETMTIFDDINDDGTIDDGERVYELGGAVFTSPSFSYPIPMTNPKIKTSAGITVEWLLGWGFIRSA